MSSQIDDLCINTIRTLSIDAINQANSGHPGLPMGAAPMAFVLWDRHLKFNPKNPCWFDRDRFVLSAGHGSMLLYSLLNLYGFDLSLEEIKNFRQWGSLTPGHPEFGLTPGVEATTGPLGQGSANAIGMAIAERRLAHLFNKPNLEIVNHFTYALVSDGDLMEGVAAEAASLAGHLGLGKLIYLYDSNDITLDGPTSLCFSKEDLGKRYEAYGWHVQEVKEGDTDLAAIDEAISKAKKETNKPSLIIVKTTIGYGSPNKQGTSGVHGSPLGGDETELTKQKLGWQSQEPFFIPSESKAHFEKAFARGKNFEARWQEVASQYEKAHPSEFKKYQAAVSGEFSFSSSALPKFDVGEKLATRQASGKVLNAIASEVETLIGGDADLSCSTNTKLVEADSFDGQTGRGRNIHFGVREHAMAAISNGICYHGGLRPFNATFFCFSDYMKPSLRLAAMNHLPVINVWTHDSIGLGEDGPTHQPIEHLMALRAVPNFLVIRPCDANETKFAWEVAMAQKKTPTGLVLTRQKLPTLEETQNADVTRGAYVLSEGNNPSSIDVILIGTGSEVHLCLAAKTLIEAEEGLSVRVVSMPCFELFDLQDAQYKEEVLPKKCINRISVEAGSSLGWQKWVGLRGKMVSMDRFGASAPAEELFKQFQFTPSDLRDKALKLLRENK